MMQIMQQMTSSSMDNFKSVSKTTLTHMSQKFFPNEPDIIEWKECFTKACKGTLEPCYERLNNVILKNETSLFFTLRIDSIDGIFTRLSDIEGDLRSQVRVSIFDLRYRTFYGRTWCSSQKVFDHKQGKLKLNINERLYFHTPIRDHDIVMIVELACFDRSNKGYNLGWTVFRPFKLTQEAKTQSKQEPNFRSGFYFGTPRALLFLDDSFEDSAYLKPINGSYLYYTFRTAKLPERIKWLIPENVIVSTADRVGGIMTMKRDSEIERLQLTSPMSAVVEDLFITLFPNVLKFETELCSLVAADRSIWNKVTIDPMLVTITERRLKIGIHNGLDYVNEPHVVQLRVETQKKTHSSHTMSKRLSVRNSLKATLSQEEAPDDTESATRLIMRNSVVLNDLFHDSLCCIVFALEYVMNVPLIVNTVVNNKQKAATPDAKKQFEAHYVIARWAAWSPFTNMNNGEAEFNVDLNLFGGSKPCNPEEVLIYKVPDTRMQDQLSSKHAPGRIGFLFKKGNQVNIKTDIDDYMVRQDMPNAALGKNISRDTDTYGQQPAPKGSKSLLEQLEGIRNLSNVAKQPQEVQQERDLLVQQRMQYNQAAIQSARGVDPKVFTRDILTTSVDLQPIHVNPYPVLALEPGQIGGRTISRASYAKLHAANFPPILDRFGKPPEVTDENSVITFDLHTEENDILACNEISLQFLAFSRAFTNSRNMNRPQSVMLTFQFYRFPEIKTPRLTLDNALDEYTPDLYSTPFILKHIDKPNASAKAKPGFMIKYNLDPQILKQGEKRLFLQYLAYQVLFIDVWDGDSLHLIGTCTLELKQLLRHGKEAVQSTYELDVLSTDYDDDTSGSQYSGLMMKEGVPYPSNSHITLQGKLHLRIGNVGFPLNDRTKSDIMVETSSASPIPVSHIVTSKTTMTALDDRLLSRKFDETSSKGFLTHSLAKAHHMTDKFREIHTALVSESNINKSLANDLPLDPLKKRKLNRMELLRKLEQNESAEPVPLLNTHKRLIDDRNKDLQVMEFYRKQSKHEQIRNKLQDFITTECSIYPTFGSVEFFEYVITNPFNEPQTVTIITSDPELQVITDYREWRNLKIIHQMYSETESNMFNCDGADMNGVKCPQLFIRPKETLHVPFKYQTFKLDQTGGGSGVNGSTGGDSGMKFSLADSTNLLIEAYNSKKSSNTKSCQVTFQCQDGNPIAVLKVIIEQQPHVVNQTFRFNVAEHTFLKKTIRLPSSMNLQSALANSLISNNTVKMEAGTENGVSAVYVRCNDSSVICESKPVPFNEPRDIFIKAPCPAAPHVKKFFLAIYADQYCSILLQVWQICIHALQRIDVSCIQGQTARFSVILKGLQSPRVVKVYPSVPEEMAVIPKDQFTLATGTVQELNVGVRSLKSGTKFYYLNVIDLEGHQLVHSWFIFVHSKPPVISKAFELTLPTLTSGNVSNYTLKRVQYTNPYTTEKTFLISTNHEELVAIKETRIKFAPNETKTLSLKFLPNLQPGLVEILVFINNENDSNEETFAIRGTYVNSIEP